MGAVAGELERAARRGGADLRTDVRVTAIEPAEPSGARVQLADGTWLRAPYVLAGCAPATLSALLGENSVPPEGSQTKINLVVRRLPRLISGLDPRTAFAGTLHLNQGYRQLAAAYAVAEGGQIPDPLPCEVYCHTLSDPSILSAKLQADGWHTLAMFGLHTPARLFTADPDGAREVAKRAALRSLQAVLAEPLEDCVARDSDGKLCIEVMTPLDIEHEVGMPGGHIFHGDLAWPWLADGAVVSTPAERWGVGTPHPGIWLCGSGAVRGGAVSGLGGHNAAMAVLESR
jgi:phytoene dehydrogenase-like protein